MSSKAHRDVGSEQVGKHQGSRKRAGSSLKRKHLLYASAVHAYDHGVYLTIITLALFVQQDFPVTVQHMLFAIALSHFPYGFGSLAAGYLSDRLGNMQALTLGLGLTAGSMLMAALAINETMFFVAIFLIGLGGSFNHPTMLTHISQIFKKRLGRSLGTFGLVGSLGQFIPPITTALLAVIIGWRIVLIVWAVLAMILLLGAIRLARDGYGRSTPKQEKDGIDMKNTHVKSVDVKNVDMGSIDAKKESSYRSEVGSLASLGFLAVLLVALFRGFYLDGAQSVLPFYSSEIYGLAPYWGGLLLTFMLVFGVPGHIVGGRLTDSLGAGKTILISSTLAMGAILLLPIPIFELFLAGLALLGFAFFLGQASENVLIAEVSSSRVRGLTFGIKFVVAFGLGAFGPVIIALALNWYSMAVAYMIVSLFILATLVAVLFLRKVRPELGT